MKIFPPLSIVPLKPLPPFVLETAIRFSARQIESAEAAAYSGRDRRHISLRDKAPALPAPSRFEAQGRRLVVVGVPAGFDLGLDPNSFRI
jgi:hypothetical protein